MGNISIVERTTVSLGPYPHRVPRTTCHPPVDTVPVSQTGRLSMSRPVRSKLRQQFKTLNKMKIQLKPLREQVIVITGASSGIGLVTARMAVKQGAKVVLVARNEDAIRQLAEDIRSQGGQALDVPCDVGQEEDIARVVEAAITEFGGFDTWVNNAGVSIFGRIEDVSVPDMKRMFDTNFWERFMDHVRPLIITNSVVFPGRSLTTVAFLATDRHPCSRRTRLQSTP